MARIEYSILGQGVTKVPTVTAGRAIQAVLGKAVRDQVKMVRFMNTDGQVQEGNFGVISIGTDEVVVNGPWRLKAGEEVKYKANFDIKMPPFVDLLGIYCIADVPGQLLHWQIFG